MTKEQRIIFGLDDILRVRVKCKYQDCSGEILIDLGRYQSIPNGCPICNQAWVHRERPKEFELIDTIRQIISDSNGPVDLLFELSDDP